MGLSDFFRSLWKRPAPPVVVVEEAVAPAPPVVAPIIETKCEPEARVLLGVRSSGDQPQRVTFLDVLRRTGAFSPEETIALGSEFVRLASLEPGPVRLREVAGHALFFTPDGRLGGALPHSGFAWMAPEVVKGQAQTERTDVFAVGLTMYAALLGDTPIQADSDMGRLTAIMGGALVPLRTQPPAALGAVVRRCLSVEPEGRFASLEELAAALKKLQSNVERLRRRAIETWEVLGRKPLQGLEPLTVPLDTEAQLLAQIRLGDEGARAVYADHLESSGRGVEAEWLRLEQRLRKEPTSAQLKTLSAMRALEVSPNFVSSVSRAELESCAISFGFRCPRTWDALGPTEDPLVRYCSACEERVHFASSIEQAEQLTFQGRCVAVADHVARGEPVALNERIASNYVGMAPVRRAARKR